VQVLDFKQCHRRFALNSLIPPRLRG
jgi:hypothetical protein